MANGLPSGRVAFYVDQQTKELRYSVVVVRNRYADGFDVIELPRGDCDDFYVNKSLLAEDPNHMIVVESGKEHLALQKLGISSVTNIMAKLRASGYEYSHTETLQEAAARELREEHGFDETIHGDMVKQTITMLPFKVNATYGSPMEYRDFIWIEGDVSKIELKHTHKKESKAADRMGVPYIEEGAWATLREIRANAEKFNAFTSIKPAGRERERALGSAGYNQSIVDWLEYAEMALTRLLKRQGVEVFTTSRVDAIAAATIVGASAVTTMPGHVK